MNFSSEDGNVLLNFIQKIEKWKPTFLFELEPKPVKTDRFRKTGCC